MRLQRALACTSHWISDRLDDEDQKAIRNRLPKRDLKDVIHSPVVDLGADLKSQRWAVYKDGQFGMDFKLGAVTGPPASWYARKGAAKQDSELQWISNQVFRQFPSQSTWADEVWTIIYHDPKLASTKPAG